MAETQQKILEVVVNNDAAIARIAELNKALDEQRKLEQQLRKELKEEGADRNALYKEIARNKEIQKQYSSEIQALSREVQNNINKSKEQEGSLKALRSEISNLTKQYDSLSRAERESAKGAELKAKINDLTNELKDAEEATQRFQRNVGNYSGGIQDAFAKITSQGEGIADTMMGAAGSSKALGVVIAALVNPIKAVTMALKMLMANPILAVIGAIVAILTKVIGALKSSEEAFNSVTGSLSIFNAAGTAVKKVLQLLGVGIAKTVEWLTKMADKLGLISDKMKTEQQLTKDQIALDLKRREVMMQNSDSELRSAQLREKATDRLTYKAKERLAFLQAAVDEEEAIARRNLELAQEQYRILEEQSKLAANSKEENDALAQAYVEMNRAQVDYLNKKKELNAQMLEATNQIKADEKALADARKAQNDAEAKALKEEIAKKKELAKLTKEELEAKLDIAKKEIEARLKLVSKGTDEEYQLRRKALQAQLDIDLQALSQQKGTEELQLLRKRQYYADLAAINKEQKDAEKAKLQAEKEEMLRYYENKVNEQIAGTRKQMEAQIELEKLRLDTLTRMADETDQQYYARKLQAEQAYLSAKKELADYEVQIERTKTDALLMMSGSLVGMFDAIAEGNESLTKVSKVLALAQIAIETGVATARGISAAMAVPFPANLAAIATTIATITAGIVSAIQTVKSAKFAQGGLVQGPGTGTSDSIPAKLSNGESVMNARTTSMFAPLLSSLNQIGGGRAFPGYGASGSQGFAYIAEAVAAGMQKANISVAVDEVQKVSNRVQQIREIASI